jgi:hypothetical protein
MKNILFLLLLCISFSGFSQKIKLTDGDLTSLKGEKALSTEFTYKNMKVGKFDKEEDYVNKKKNEYNEKEPGRGDSWEKAWIDDRKERFEPQFRELFSKNSELSTVDAKAKYTMIVNTTFTEVGFNVGVVSKSAFINLEITIIETANRDKVIAKITLLNSPGRTAMGFDFETGLRLQEAYAKAGKELGKFLAKRMEK